MVRTISMVTFTITCSGLLVFQSDTLLLMLGHDASFAKEREKEQRLHQEKQRERKRQNRQTGGRSFFLLFFF